MGKDKIFQYVELLNKKEAMGEGYQITSDEEFLIQDVYREASNNPEFHELLEKLKKAPQEERYALVEKSNMDEAKEEKADLSQMLEEKKEEEKAEEKPKVFVRDTEGYANKPLFITAIALIIIIGILYLLMILGVI